MSHLSHFWLGLHGWRREGRRRKEEEEEEVGEDQTNVCFHLGIKCILDHRVLVWRLVAPCSRVLWKRSPKP